MGGKKTITVLEPLNGQRHDGESDKAVVACNDYLRMGVRRSLRKLLAVYQERRANGSGTDSPPTTLFNTLATWSGKFNWQERASAYDAEWEAQKELERKAVLAEGLALDYERTTRLVRLADFLEGQIYHQNASGAFRNVWVPDVKSIGSGEYAERVDIERFNGEIIAQYRATLDDIAKEVGGRVKKADLTSGGKPIAESLTDEQRIARIAALLDAARARRDGQASGSDEDA